MYYCAKCLAFFVCPEVVVVYKLPRVNLQAYYIIFIQPDKPLPPRDVIDRAIAQGIIDGEGISDSSIKLIKKKSNKSKGRFKLPFHHHGIPMTIAAQQKIVQKKSASAKKIFRV